MSEDGGLPSLDDLAAMVEERARPIDEEPHVARLRMAIEIGHELGATGDALIERFVSEARAADLSWTQIGLQFGAIAAAPGAWPGPWAPTAREALGRASADARQLGHDYVGTEHVLLGVLSTEGGVAAEVLAALGVKREAILATSCLTPGSSEHDRLQLMPRLKQGLEHAQRIARGLDCDAPDTEHLLAGILAVPGAMAAEVLKRVGAPAPKVQAALAARLDTEPERLMATRRRRRRLLTKAS
jgi:Clp amino terminal domain, pathogenicity island component